MVRHKTPAEENTEMVGENMKKIITGQKKELALFSIFVLISLIIKSFYIKYRITAELNLEGLLTEICFLTLLFTPILILKTKFLPILLLIIDLGYTVLCLTTLVYFDYYHTIFTYQSITQISQVGEISDGIVALLKPEYALLFSDFLVFLLFPGIQNSIFSRRIQFSKVNTKWCLGIGLIVVCFSLLHSSKIMNEVSKYEKLGIIGFQFSKAASGLQHIFAKENHINAATLAKYRPVQPEENARFYGKAKSQNIIIVQLEAVQNFLINQKIAGREITPNLNKLIKSSYYFPHIYSQVGKGNTSDAEFIINTSLYPLGDIPMSTEVAGKEVPGLPRILKQRGYHTATFHANSVSFWNRNQLYQALGFDEYYDKKFFGTGDILSYGVSDEVMYQKTANKLAEFQQKGTKYYAHIIALSSHFPYKLPDSKKQLAVELPPRFENSMVGSYIEAVSYADYAFGQFMEALKKAGIYDRTLIVVYGDHQGLQVKDQKDSELVKEMFEKPYDSVLDHLNIPLIIKAPSQRLGKTVDMAGGLVDIYPTIANLAGIDLRNEIVFGTDLLNALHNSIGIRFYAPTGTYVNQSYRFLPGKSNEQGEMMSLQTRKQTSASKQAINGQYQVLTYMNLSDQYVKSLPKLK